MLGITKNRPSRSGPLIDKLPPEVAAAHEVFAAAIAHRTEALQRQSALAAEEPAALGAAEEAAAGLDQAEIDLALATDENFEQLSSTRDAKAVVAAEARAALETLRRRRRGIAAIQVEAEAAIEPAAAEWQRASTPFRAELRSLYRGRLVAAIEGFVHILRLGHAIEAGLPRSGLRSALEAIVIPDVVEQPGRYLVKGALAWIDDVVDLAGSDLRQIDSDPESQALRELLGPLGNTERVAASIVREVQANRMREEEAARLSAPPRPRPKAPPDPTLTMTDAEYRAHRAAEVNASRIYPPPGPNPTYSRPPPPGERQFHRG
jgi:hypothetical protein